MKRSEMISKIEEFLVINTDYKWLDFKHDDIAKGILNIMEEYNVIARNPINVICDCEYCNTFIWENE